VDDDLELTGTATGISDGSKRIQVQVGVSHTSTKKYRAYAEVWGVDSGNKAVAVCWVGGMVFVEGTDSNAYVSLELDLSWAAMTHASAPFTLKNVYLQDANALVPVAKAASVPVKQSGRVPVNKMINQITRTSPILSITEEMKYGVRPAHIQGKMDNYTAASGSLVLIHGYCASDNPFQDHSSIFQNGVYFLNPRANLGHDEFAEKVADFTENLAGWSGIGHSQGGNVLLHLNQYYWSTMDVVRTQRAGGRLIQSLGTPFKGCTGAGSAANLIKLFGYGCGANDDLTVDASLLWLAGISAAERAEVYYYTTTYKLGSFFGDYCNLAVNMLLQWPNDGTTELDYAQLPGGNSLGNKQKWCHTTDMGYPAQYDDPDRNKEMNANAAR